MQWLARHAARAPETGDLLAQVGALLIGRRTFFGDDPNAGTEAEGAFGGQWEGPAFVVSHDPPADAAVAHTTFLDDLPAAIAQAREAAAGRYVNVLGAEVARRCLELGELDEVAMHVVPVLLGDGTPVYGVPGGAEVALEPVDPSPVGGMLWFRVV